MIDGDDDKKADARSYLRNGRVYRERYGEKFCCAISDALP